MEKENKLNSIIFIFLFVISSVIIFNKLGSSSVNNWDEAIYGENALQILKTNDWVVMKCGGLPDPSVLKPPVGAWLIAISFIIFGVNEFALRFWSALAGVGTIMAVYLFGKSIANKTAGFLAAILLLTIPSFIGLHGARTGDYDVILTFFLTSALYSFYLYDKDKKNKFFIISTIFFSLAVLTKGIVGLFFLPIILCYLVYNKNLKQIVSKNGLYALTIFVIITFPWFILRTLRQKGFISEMISYDLFKRTTEAVEGHVGGWNYYFTLLAQNLGLFFMILVISVIYAANRTSKKNKEYSLLLIWIVFFLGVFTIARTKLYWYITPVYPAICILTAISINELLIKLKKLKIIIFIMLIALLILPLNNIIKLTNEAHTDNQNYQKIKNFKLYLNTTDNLMIRYGSQYSEPSEIFYLDSFTKGKFRVFTSLENISANPGDLIMSFENETTRSLLNNSEYTLIKGKENFYLFKKA